MDEEGETSFRNSDISYFVCTKKSLFIVGKQSFKVLDFDYLLLENSSITIYHVYEGVEFSRLELPTLSYLNTSSTGYGVVFSGEMFGVSDDL